MVLLHEQELQNQAGHGAAVQGDQLSGGERHVARYHSHAARASRPERAAALGVM